MLCFTSEEGETQSLLSDRENLKMPYLLLAKGDQPQVVIIEEGTDDQLEAHGYLESPCRRCIYHTFCFLTAGILLLLVKWYPNWRVKLICRPCSVSSANVLILKDLHGSVSVINVIVQPVTFTLPPELAYSRSLSSVNNHHENSMNFNYSPAISYRYFIHNCVKYVWDSKNLCFKRLRGYDYGVRCSEFYDRFFGFSDVEEGEMREIYGPNTITIDVSSYLTLFIEEVLNPFYIFQIFSIILWLIDNYRIYASCILIISLTSIILTLRETKKQQKILRNMVAKSNSVEVTVRRNTGVFEDVPAADLVPGDVIAIPPHGCLMACDAVLIAGNCIVNESMLTGESVPETKTPLLKLDDEIYCPTVHKRHTLFCGTEIIQTRYYENNRVLAVVTRTGFSTSKGELVRSILFSKPVGFKFYKDAYQFVALLFFISAFGMAYSIYCYILRHSPIGQTIVRALDIITIVVPPALPAAMTVSISIAQNRLRKQKIFCINPPRINICGKLKLICFDKTGTLTEEGLDFWGIIPTFEGKFRELEHTAHNLNDKSRMKICMSSCHSLTIIDNELRGDPMDLKMFQATKWELEEPGNDTTKFDVLIPTVVRPTTETLPLCNGVESGDIMLTQETSHESKLLSIPMSPTKDCSLLEENPPYEVGIIRQFPFSSGLQRMSVICRTLGAEHFDLYCKGAPEKITSLCLSETVPVNFPELLKHYTVQGYRVIALAYRELRPDLSWRKAQKVKREDVEKDLTFLGLLILQNTLKPQTTPVIKTLSDAKIRTVMVTGDNVMTALSVARECSMIPESDKVIVVKGFPPDHEKPACLNFEYADIPSMSHSNSTLSEAVSSIHGDCSPVLARYIETKFNNYHFVMDGKAFAVIRSYFPELLNKVLLRGTVYARMNPDQKTQLVESLQAIGYVAGMCGDGANDCGALKAADVGISLSDTEASVAAPFTSNIADITCVPIVIRQGRTALMTSYATFRFIALYSLTQFISVLILYTVDTNLTDQMFLWIDMGLITCFSLAMGYAKAYDKLVPQRPRCSLFSVPNVVFLLGQVLFIVVAQVLSLIYLQHQKWYVPVVTEEEDIFPCWENTVVFFVSCYQYLMMAYLVSDGPPYRKPWYTNYFLLPLLIIGFLITTFLVFNPFPVIAPYVGIETFKINEHLLFRATLVMVAACNFFLAVAFDIMVANAQWLRAFVRIIKQKKEPKNEFKRINLELSKDYNWPPIDQPICASGPILICQ
ncbi:polyamine-transporting ATPase 13A3 isoform X3 [Parasteatoda tepidariorum]|uniref:polyamine-transporting ATPase 13A3 isoform X3 n=1 Tax=Parasteatoda tepidariorum TaxID=114398 RepID=UPI00077FB3A1|nr:polyamine-transporting ATPase 13A3 isoform X4 [Parasteatoda tepidariorum]